MAKTKGATMRDHEKELDALAAETMALQTLFVGLCNALVRRGADMESVVVEAFDYAENIVTSGAIKAGKAGRASHTLKAVEIVEALRAGIVTDHDGAQN